MGDSIEREVYLRLRRLRAVDLPTDEQVLGAVKATFMLVEDGVITMSRAAEVCGIKLLAYRIIANKHCKTKVENLITQ